MKGKFVPDRPHAGRRARLEPDEVAVRAFSCLAADPERLDRFLALTGLAPDTIREAAGTPGFLSAVLDHVASDERLLLEIASEAGFDPTAVEEARQRLAPDPDWSP